jgi:histidinol-phosphatase (PHP family)
MHVHATSSPDASLTETELARRAADKGLDGLGFVAHVDFHPGDFCTGGFNRADYERAFDEAAVDAGTRLELAMGVEIGEPLRFAEEAGKALRGMEPDFVTGALHWIDDRFTLDESAFTSGDPMELVEEYYRRTLDIVSSCDMDILAHLGIFRRGMARAGIPAGFDEVSLWPDLLGGILETMIHRRIALEINTAGLRRPEKTTYPTPGIVELFASMDGELVTVGSDTHREPWLFFGLEEAADLLRRSGIREAYRFSRRKPLPYSL